ncbi:MAG: ABC transporter permease [Thermoproteota archaeon]|nr:ABC transporter permease [Candidatus Brockarchaeota archaeon]
MGWKEYLLRRIIQLFFIVFIVLILNFLIINLAPGDPASIMAGELATKEYIEAVRQKWGLNKPIYERLISYVSNVVHGDFGYSFTYSQSVLSLIAERIPITLMLTLTSSILAFVIGLLLAVRSAQNAFSKEDIIVSNAMLVLYSVPSFWLGLVLIGVFGVGLRLLPTSGMTDVRAANTGLLLAIDILIHSILPISTLTAIQIPVYYKIARNSIVEQSSEDYALTFTMAGMNRSDLFRKYILRNSLLPPVTVFALHLGYILSGAVLVEIVFGWPGMGRLLLGAVYSRDYPLIMGIYLITSITVAFANFFVDILYVLLDPRVKYTNESS